MNNLVYEDDPWALIGLRYLSWSLARRWARYLKLWPRVLACQINMSPVWLTIFIAGLLLAFTPSFQEVVFFSVIGATLVIMLTIWYALMPTKYQIFNEKIRIVLGWVIHFDIPFSNIGDATAATFGDLWGLNLNFINSYSSDDILQITRKRGAKVHITPWDRKLFLEHLNKALADWKQSNPS